MKEKVLEYLNFDFSPIMFSYFEFHQKSRFRFFVFFGQVLVFSELFFKRVRQKKERTTEQWWLQLWVASNSAPNPEDSERGWMRMRNMNSKFTY